MAKSLKRRYTADSDTKTIPSLKIAHLKTAESYGKNTRKLRKSQSNLSNDTLHISTAHHPSTVPKIHLTQLQRKIFMLLSVEDRKYSGADIVRFLNKRKRNVYYAIDRLIELGLIKKDGRTYPQAYNLTPAGKNQKCNLTVGYGGECGIYDRSHAWKFRVDVKSLPMEVPDGWKSWSASGTQFSATKFPFTDGPEVEVRLQIGLQGKKSIVISFSEVPGEDANETQERAFYIAYTALEWVREEVKGIKLAGNLELVNVTLSGAHHALVNEPFAVKCHQDKISVKGKTASLDCSKPGKPELEFDRMTPGANAEAAMGWMAVIDAYNSGQWNPFRTDQRVETILVIVNKMAMGMENVSKVLENHETRLTHIEGLLVATFSNQPDSYPKPLIIRQMEGCT